MIPNIIKYKLINKLISLIKVVVQLCYIYFLKLPPILYWPYTRPGETIIANKASLKMQ